MKKTKYYVLFEVLKAAGSKGATPEACAKALGFKVGSIAPYMVSLRQKFGAKIESIKDGRSVTHYKLLNAAEVEKVITPNRRVVAGKVAAPAKATKIAKVAKPAKAAKVQKVTKTVTNKKNIVAEDGSVPTLDSDLEISEITDTEMNDLKSQLGLA